MTELSAIGLYIHYWWPEIPTWVSALGFFIFINVINLLHVKLFGEMEFWLAIIKVLAMIAFSSYLLATGSGDIQSSLQNLWELGGFFPNGVMGLVMAMAMIMFAFGGIELVGIAAAVSVYNSTNYCTSRMLLGLAQQDNAPKFLSKINPRGIPVNAVMVSAFFTLMCVLINYLFPEKAFSLLMMLVVAAIVINWVVISYTHLKFKKHMIAMNAPTQFSSIAYPFTNYLCIIFMCGILLIMSQTPDMRIAVIMIPVWIAVLSIAYFFKNKKITDPQLALKDKMRSVPKA